MLIRRGRKGCSAPFLLYNSAMGDVTAKRVFLKWLGKIGE
jgi:hypothetical protein